MNKYLPNLNCDWHTDTGDNGVMRVMANAIFERVVYHCSLVDGHNPARPTLVVDALLRDGDADGPLLIAVADFKRMVGVEATLQALPALRKRGRTAVTDGVEYVTFPIWETAVDDDE